MFFGDISERLGPDVTILEDFEGVTIDGSRYSGSTGSFSVSSTGTLEGNDHLESDGAWGSIRRDGTTTTRGNKYSQRFYSTQGGGNKWFLIGSQAANNAFDDCYYVAIDVADDMFRCQERDGNSVTGGSGESVTLSASTEYRATLEYGPTGETNNITGTLYDANDNVLAGPISFTSDKWTGGSYGWYAGNTGGDYMDYITETPL